MLHAARRSDDCFHDHWSWQHISSDMQRSKKKIAVDSLMPQAALLQGDARADNAQACIKALSCMGKLFTALPPVMSGRVLKTRMKKYCSVEPHMQT